MVLEKLNNLKYKTILNWFIKWTMRISIVCALLFAWFATSWKSLVIYDLGENYKFEAAEIHVLTHYPDSILWFNQSDSALKYFRTIEEVEECSYNDKYILVTQNGTRGNRATNKNYIVTAPIDHSDTTVYWIIDKMRDVAYGPYCDSEFHTTWEYIVKDMHFKTID